MNIYEELEKKIIGCIFERFCLIEELFIDEKCFLNVQNRKMILFLKKIYREDNSDTKVFDFAKVASLFPTEEKQNMFCNYYTNLISDTFFITSEFYSYQETLQDSYRKHKISELISLFGKTINDPDALTEEILKVNNENLYSKQKDNKKTPEEMLKIIRDDSRKIQFKRLNSFNEKVIIKQNTVNVIAARPSEGKSALALNLLCDLSSSYKCLYFNMEMTEAEIYERMLGIVSKIPIEDLRKPQTEYQSQKIEEFANRLYTQHYEVVNGSKSINSIKSKIIKEQKEEHLIVFLDYIGYVTANRSLSDKDRIGIITRELNNLTKDYNCTIFIIAQINRNGSDNPTMNDLKDSGELEQSADTIILINDPNKEDNQNDKIIDLIIPKCRGSKRNVAIKLKYLKNIQRMEEIEIGRNGYKSYGK